MSSMRLGFVRCEHCGRQFNPHSGARHIPWCAKQQSENRKHKLSADKREALERYKWRISYRPSNQIASQQQSKNVILTDIDARAKKSSINSSATLSSPSAGSTTSISTSVASTNERVQRSQRPQIDSHQKIASQAPSGHLLKRSISSHTLTKQHGISSGSGGAANNWRAQKGEKRDSIGSNETYAKQAHQQRTKSVNDLSNMSEIVETLAKRMDEIYAQNQLLLARISKGNANAGLARQSEEDCSSDNGIEEMLKCHHCKSSCVEAANYCHKCGCKMYAIGTTTSNTTTTGSSSPG